MTQSSANSDTATPVLKDQLRADLTAAMKARDELTKSTLRMALAAVGEAEVAGPVAKQLTDTEVMAVLTKEVRKRKDSAEAFDGAGRTELADRERAESAVIAAYLPAPLTDDELAGLVSAAVDEVAATTGTVPTIKQMGLVVKAVQAKAAGRADGGKVAALVKATLA
ncbi:GatB/YqeY domain-containing protein [Nakamurella silvestris]|nr:GatB/YqeY domain-containing protein [Nakamurella silvestris]